MLDDVTKRRIDTLRDILVGKLPDPKAQVEQITNGLIYKFMNDMDDESVSMGGKTSYFAGKFSKYSWKNFMNPKISGVEKLNLYTEAIGKMETNEKLPELFRDIFKDSFLPFKDPKTLNMFLKEINEFNYSHSEKLGDAFEYLLSFMGSQGDAGQFRTPRHIIDFIVEIVSPQKNETILDPACGTAGFLISSYNHILKQNTKKNLGDLLNASDRKKIGKNLNGYDISPDMVKMSLVNMYLHQFKNPKIYEYDTLSSEDKWKEYYDVILANPPFFSPKGGIMPHNRFGVRSTKAEVLFVDYINEHLKPNGRAGIIVPEGIIFQTGIAYKQLRKRLIETSLIGVISLPAGVFQPYSGVKTSILILDKEKNKKNNEIFFIKIKNDGFDLTANRKKIKENELPNIVQLIKNDEISKLENVKKEEIFKNDCSLNYSSYKNDELINSNYKLVLLKEYADLKRGTSITKKDITDGDIPVIAGGQKPAYFHNKSNRSSNCITVSSSGAYAGYVAFHTNPIFASDCFTIEKNSPDLNQKFLFYLLKFKQELIYSFQTGGGQPHVYAKDFDKFKIPLPSIETQNQIVEELDGYQKIIDGCRQVIENYKPIIDFDPSWKKIELNNLFEVKSSKRVLQSDWKSRGIPFYRGREITKLSLNGNVKNELFIDEDYFEELKDKYGVPNKDDIMITAIGTIGNTYIVQNTDKFYFKDASVLWLKKKTNINSNYFKYFFKSKEFFNQLDTGLGATVDTLPIGKLGSIKVPIPNKNEIEELTNNLIKEEKFIENNKTLIELQNNKKQNLINKIWSN